MIRVALEHQIEKQATYLLKTPLAKAKLSDVEKGYAERYLILVHRHFQNSVTQNLPDRLGRLDEEEMGGLFLGLSLFSPSLSPSPKKEERITKADTNTSIPVLLSSTVVRPELDQAVFARARKDCPPIRLPECVFLVFLHYPFWSTDELTQCSCSFCPLSIPLSRQISPDLG